MNNSIKNNVSNYNFIDLMKFVMCILIVCIHTDPLEQFSLTVNYVLVDIIARVAVPFFFITSGFLYGKSIVSRGVNNKYLCRLIKLYLIATLIYLPMYIINNDHSFLVGAIAFIRAFIFSGGAASQLWYFTALIFAIFVINISIKKNISLEKIFIISMILYLIGLFGGSWYGITKFVPIVNKIFNIYLKVFITTRNGIFVGLVYTLMGLLIYRKKINLNSQKKCVIGILSGFIMLTIETLLIDKFDFANGHNATISLLPLSYFIFNLVIQVKISDKPIYSTFRKMSTIIFIFHILFRDIVGLFIANNLIIFVITLLLSIFVSLLIIKLQKYKSFSWLKYIM